MSETKLLCAECGGECEYFEYVDMDEYDPEDGVFCCVHNGDIEPSKYCPSCAPDYWADLSDQALDRWKDEKFEHLKENNIK